MAPEWLSSEWARPGTRDRQGWRRPGLSPARKMTTKEREFNHQKTLKDTKRWGDTGVGEVVAHMQEDSRTRDL